MEISVLKAVAAELAHTLTGSRLVELAEGGSGEVFLVFKGVSGKRALLVSPRPDLPRMYLISGKPPKSKELTPFASSLNNSITGSNVVSVYQPGLERTVLIEFSGKKGKSTLIVEMAGKKPNIILVDDEGRITLAQSYVSISDEAQRPLLPGLAYEPPPLPRKGNLFSPLLAREAAAPGVSEDELIARLDGPYAPCIYETEKGLVLAAFPLKQYEGLARRDFTGMNEAAEYYYGEAASRKRAAGVRAATIRELKKKLSAACKKVSAIKTDLARADDAELNVQRGQALLASLPHVPAGADSVTLPDLYSDGNALIIPLNPGLSPARNADAYFKKAKKARAGIEVLTGRLKGAEDEADELAARLTKVEESGFEGGADEKVTEARDKTGKTGRPSAVPEFPSFKSSDGYEVVFARNAKMNDLLTFKFAQPMDLWLHAQGYHGGHVIVRNPERRPDIPLQTILEAAQVAAYNSGAKKDSSVAVDYTFKKYVRKPKDPAPGQAIFTNNKTVFVEPKKR